MDETTKKDPVDVFHWANQVDAYKDSLEVDLFMFTKGFTVYATNYAKELKNQLKVLFLYDMVSDVQTGGATGMAVREFETNGEYDNVLERTTLDKVEHAQEVIEQILYGEETLEVFREGDHEFKKIKGMIARFSRKGAEPFFVVKLLPQSQVLKGTTAWMYSGDSFQPFSADAGLRVTPDNQVLITGDDVFVFSPKKFVRLFGYDAKQFAITVEKISEIEAKFKLKYPEGISLEALAKENKTLQNKIQKVEITEVTQDQLVDQSDSLDLGLMVDDTLGAIIIVDSKDAIKFLNLLNDDYITSQLTGIKYEVKSKKELRDSPSSDQDV